MYVRLQAIPRGCRSNDERNKGRNAAEFYLVTEERSNMEGCKIFDVSEQWLQTTGPWTAYY